MGKLTEQEDGGLRYTRNQLQLTGSDVNCPRCKEKVFYNEEKRAQGKSWHAKCFNCATCHRSLTSSTCSPHEEEIYCSSCHRNQFGIKGYGQGLATNRTILDIRPSYQITSESRDSSDQTDYTSLFQYKVKSQQLELDSNRPLTVEANSRAEGAGQWMRSLSEKIPTLSIDDRTACARCRAPVFHAEEARAAGQVWHRDCFRCVLCQRSLDSMSCETHDTDIFCSVCYRRQFGAAMYVNEGVTMPDDGKASSRRPSLITRAPVRQVSLNKVQESRVFCPRCEQPVYYAEQVKVQQQMWHRHCLKCGLCKTSLNPTNLCEHQGSLYCKLCYSRNFGPDKHSKPDKSTIYGETNNSQIMFNGSQMLFDDVFNLKSPLGPPTDL